MSHAVKLQYAARHPLHHLKVKLLTEDAQVPKYQTTHSAGFDLATIDTFTLAPGERKIVRTGLAFSIPIGHEMQIRPRSGLAAKFGITVVNAPGTIDADYLDEVKIILLNTGTEPWSAKSGDRVAQGVIKPVEQATIEVVDDFDAETKEKDRGGGFGSTGV